MLFAEGELGAVPLHFSLPGINGKIALCSISLWLHVQMQKARVSALS
jgi:hypothetical protein